MSRRRRSAPMGNKLGRAILGLMLIAFGLNAIGIEFEFGLILLVGGLIMLGVMMNAAQTSGSSSSGGARTGRGEDPFARASGSMRRHLEETFADMDFSLASEQEQAQRQGGSTGQRRAQTSAKRQPTGNSGARQPGRMHRVAVKAVKKAGQDPKTLVVAPVDVGVLVYEDRSATPTLYRETRLPDEAEFIRPFTLVRSPQAARGSIRFELIDGNGEQRFVDESEWELKAGETFVYPPTWLPMRMVDDFSGEWTMRIYAANMLLAEHEFMWRDFGGGEFRQFLNGDGEINEKLAEEVSSARLGRLSLEDLLDDQEGGVIELDPEAEAAARRNEMINRQYNNRRR